MRTEAELLVFEDDVHGSPWDRGCADSWYSRPFNPHKYPAGTYNGERVVLLHGTQEWEAYAAGYEWNEVFGGKKEW